MAIINAAEILVKEYKNVFGKRAPKEEAAEILGYIGLESETTKTDLREEIEMSAENVLEGLNEIFESSNFQGLIISLAIARAADVDLPPRVVKAVEKVRRAIENIYKPNVVELLQENLKEIGPLQPRKRESFSSIGNFDPELDMPPTIEEARYRSNNWQSPW